jgi:glycerol uptake facilitator-like aquaporin
MGYISQLLTQTKNLWVEAFGTFLLVAVSTSALVTLNISGQAMTAAVMLVGILAYAFTYGWLIFAFNGWQRGYFNPAVTLLCWLRGQITLTWLAAAILLQLAGGLLASILVALLFGPMAIDSGLGAVHPLSTMGPIAALVAEAIGTIFLLITILKLNPDDNAAKQGLLVGCSLAIGQLLAVGVSGAALNPIRALAPQLVAADAGNWWVYLTGPLAASLAVWAGAGWLQKPAGSTTSNLSPTPAVQAAAPQSMPESESNEELQHKAEQALAQLRESEDHPTVENNQPLLQPSFQPEESQPAPAKPALPSRQPLPKPSTVRFVDFDEPIDSSESASDGQ